MYREELIIDIGCGDEKLTGAVGTDRRMTKNVDIIADASKLPFKDGSFDHVHSSHLIEHFSHREVKDVVKEWVRVLKKSGIIEVRCPWLRVRALIFFLRPTWKNVRNIYGGQEYAGNFHKCGFSYKLLKELLEECGISNIRWVRKEYYGITILPNCLHGLHLRGVKK